MHPQHATYIETQVLGRTRIGLFVTVSTILTMALTITMVVSRGASPRDIIILIAVFLLTLGLLWLLRLTIRVDEEQLRIRFWPIPSKRLDPPTITGIEIVRFDPLSDFGGWGYKVTRRHGRVYCISGHSGIRFRVGQHRYVVSSNNPAELLLAVVEAGAPAPDSLEPRSVREPPRYQSL